MTQNKNASITSKISVEALDDGVMRLTQISRVEVDTENPTHISGVRIETKVPHFTLENGTVIELDNAVFFNVAVVSDIEGCFGGVSTDGVPTWLFTKAPVNTDIHLSCDIYHPAIVKKSKDV